MILDIESDVISDLLPSFTSISNIINIFLVNKKIKNFYFIFKIAMYVYFIGKSILSLMAGKINKTQSLKIYLATTILNLVIFLQTSEIIHSKFSKKKDNK